MAFFDAAKRREEIEKDVLGTLSQKPILDDLISDVLNSEEEWLTSCQGYYDSRQRDVIIAPDLFRITWKESRLEGDRRIEEVKGIVSYSYTSYGYIPLHSLSDKVGTEVLSVRKIVYLWSQVLRERLQAQMQGCQFGSVNDEKMYSQFTYTVPALAWKHWF